MFQQDPGVVIGWAFGIVKHNYAFVTKCCKAIFTAIHTVAAINDDDVELFAEHAGFAGIFTIGAQLRIDHLGICGFAAYNFLVPGFIVFHGNDPANTSSIEQGGTAGPVFEYNLVLVQPATDKIYEGVGYPRDGIAIFIDGLLFIECTKPADAVQITFVPVG